MSQSIFLDPELLSNTPGGGNSGNGVVTITLLTHFTISQTYVLTCIQTTPNVVFSVVGSLDGTVGLASENVEFIDNEKKIGLLITPGANPFAIGDTFSIEVQQGTDLNKINIDSYDELPQKNFSDDNDDSLRYDDVEKTYSFNVDEITDAGSFFEGNAYVQARDFITNAATPYTFDAITSQQETGDETLFRKLLKITDNEPEDTQVNVAGTNVVRADGTTYSLTNKDGEVIDYSGAVIDFATGTGSGVTAFSPSSLLASEYVWYGLALNNESVASIEVFPGVPDAVLVNAAKPALPIDYICVGFVLVQDDGIGGIGNINNIGRDSIVQLIIASASAGLSDGLIQEILTLKYAIGIIDQLDDVNAFDIPNTTGNFINQTYNIEYDNKIITVVGNTITLGSPCAFTVAVGDVVVQNDDVQVITSLVSQTNFDVLDGSVFSSGLNGTMSQKAQTINLTEYGDVESRPIDYYQTDITQSLLFYKDSVFQDTGNIPGIALSISSDGSFYTDRFVRPEDFTDEHTAQTISTFGQDMYIRFFSNITSGSGTSILESYRSYFHLRNQIGQIVENSRVVIERILSVAIEVTNNTGFQIDKFKVVKTTGAGNGEIEEANNTSFADALGIGITTEDVADGADTEISISGIITNANTTLGFLEGTELFLGTNGDIIDIAPSTPGEFIIKIGEIVGNDLLIQLERRGGV